jgi:predicted transcriptional regulator
MTTATMPMSLRVDAFLRTRLGNIARIEKRTAHALALEAVKTYVDTKEDQAKWNAQAMESWQHYQETGLHLAQGELDTWLSTWGTPHETAVPQCHA